MKKLFKNLLLWWKDFHLFSAIKNNFVFSISIAIVLFWFLVFIFADFIAPYDPLVTYEPYQKSLSTGPEGYFHLLGTDRLGRDMLSRIIYGSRTVFVWVFIANISAYLVGVIPGLIAGYYGKWVDSVLSFIANILLAFPVLVLYILIIILLGASNVNIVIAVVFVASPAVFRIARGMVLDIKTRTFVKIALLRGESHSYIILKEILPNCTNPLLVDFCLRIGYTTIMIGILGFLGLGFPPPTPDWGGMINENRVVAIQYPHMVIYPALAISSFVIAVNFIADGINRLKNVR